MLLAAPKNIRDLFEAMSTDPAPASVESFIRRFDWSKTAVQDIYQTFLNRKPESEDVASRLADKDRRSVALGSMAGEEFQRRIVELALRAYPDKQRLIHIHIPKTAGVDLRDKLERRLPFIHHDHHVRDAYPTAQLFAHLVKMARRAKSSDQILATGHIPLSWYWGGGLCRPTDRVFTVIREPRASLMSAINFYIRRFQEEPDALDTRMWAKAIAAPPIGKWSEAGVVREFGMSILRTESLTRQTFATAMLGQGNYESAMALIIRSNIELVPLEAYNAWLSEEWGVDSATRANTSPQVLELKHFSQAQLRYMDDMLADDYKLHERILAAWRKKGGTRIFGSNLVRD